MKVGIIGRTNVGKSTFFKALTLENVAIEDRPFTTIGPNKGVGYIHIKCPEKEFGVKCQPHNAPCINGARLVPLEIIDVAGLISGASEGRGLGNKFLSDTMEADGLIEVVDISGKTNGEGAPAVEYDSGNDVQMVKNELELWITSIILRSRARPREGLAEAVYRNLSGLKIPLSIIKDGVKKLDIDSIEERTAASLSAYVLAEAKPMVVACNKMDAAKDLNEKLERLKKSYDYDFIPCSAAAELTLKEAEKHGFIEYELNDFKVLKELDSAQIAALDTIRTIIKRNDGTGVQTALNKLLFEKMRCKVVFTVEDEKRLCDGRGRILPDAYIVTENTTPRDVAGLIHSDVAANYKGAIDCRTSLKIKNDEPVKNGQILKILV